MIKQVLKEYQEKYLSSNSGLKALLNGINRAHLGLNKELINLIKSLAAEQNIKVAIIGQFSSGKSTLLNKFLPEPILATGARPISATCVRILSGEFCAYERYANELIPVSGSLNDQSKGELLCDEIIIFSPNEHLKGLELIDTPGLNANAKDESVSRALWANSDAFIWLSNASAASKASELASLANLPNAPILCLLTQADLLDNKAQIAALNYAKSHFKNAALFSSVTNLGMQDLLDFLASLKPDLKQAKLKRILNHELALIKDHKEHLNALLDELITQLNHTSLSYCALAKDDLLKDLSNKILEQIIQTSKKISELLSANLKSKKAFYYQKAKGLLNNDKFIQNSYEYLIFKPSDVVVELFYNDERFKKELKRLAALISSEFSALINRLENEQNSLINELNHAKTKMLLSTSLAKVNEHFSKGAKSFYEALNEKILSPLDAELAQIIAQLKLLNERINLKALNNFEAATELCAAHFYERIMSSREFYEQNNKDFSLYAPSLDEINKRLLTHLCFYEFDDLLSNKKILNRLFKDFSDKYCAVCDRLSAQINKEKSKLEKTCLKLEGIFQISGIKD